MDNEEIRELLKKLKERSDESTAVKSQVIRIHFDTPKEARKREAAKRKAEKKARELKEAEEAARLAEQEERERYAEELAAAAVAEAKAEAARNFDLQLPEEDEDGVEEEGAGEENLPDDSQLMNLNWDPRKSRGFAKKEEEKEEKDENDEGQEETDDGPSLWSSIKEQTSSFFSDLLRSKKKKNEKKDKPESEKEKSDRTKPEKAESEKDESGKEEPADGPDLSDLSDLSDLDDESSGGGVRKALDRDADEDEDLDEDEAEEKRSALKKNMEEWKKRMEEPPRYNLRHARIPSKPVKAMPKLPWGNEKNQEDEKEKPDIETGQKEAVSTRPAKGMSDPTQPDFESDEAFFMEEDDESSGMDIFKVLFGRGRKSEKKQKIELESEGIHKDAGRDAKETQDLSKEDRDRKAFQDTEGSPEEIMDGAAPPDERADAAGHGEMPSDAGAFLDPQISGSGVGREAQSQPAPGEESAKDNTPKKIELVNLNESANNRGIEVIDLDSQDTGPLPDLSQGAGRRRKKNFYAEGSPKQKRTWEAPKIAMSFSPLLDFCRDRMKTILLALSALLAVLALVLLSPRILHSSSMDNTEITADEGLNIRVRQQPKTWVDSGNVVLSIGAPETIKTILVNGQSVGFTGDKSCELAITATSSRLHVLVASADKERSAVVKLAYVDSEPPVVNVSEAGGLVTLSGQDDSSGTSAIYYGTTVGLSEVPEYHEYTEPFSQPEENVLVSYYAVDKAGNKSVPVTSKLIEAKSISFDRTVYNIYPDSTIRLNLRITPEDAFCNNLKITSSDESVVEVTNGTLHAVREGEADVTASADGLESVSCHVIVSTSRRVTLSMIGDCTLGTDVNFSPMNSFTAYQNMYGNQYFFEKVRRILEADDGTFANLEGTLTTADTRANKTFAFRGDPSYTDILKDGSVEVVTLANNHSSDYGEQSLLDTEQNLTDAGIAWCKGDTIAYQDLNGVNCAFIGIYALENGLETLEQVKSSVKEAKGAGAEVIVVAFHWGAELVSDISDDQKTLAHTAIDEGATLVVGHHPHILGGIETYKNRYIVYSLANFCFGGSASPSSYDTIIFQQTFTVNAAGVEENDDIAIIPCHTSSINGSNNYQPTPVTGEEATSIMTTIDQLSAVFAQSYSQYMLDGTTIE